MELFYQNQREALFAALKRTGGVSEETTAARCAAAVAAAVCRRVKEGKILIFAGGRYKGEIGYLAALSLSEQYEVAVLNVGDATGEDRCAKQTYIRQNGRLLTPDTAEDFLCRAACFVDAVDENGVSTEMRPQLDDLLPRIAASPVARIAIDVPFGVGADKGTLSSPCFFADETVSFLFAAPGLFSYPAKEAVGVLTVDDLGWNLSVLRGTIATVGELTDEAWARAALPARSATANKGTFGKALVVTGSCAYRGAAFLSLAAALRGGAGYVTFFGDAALTDALLPHFPEALYRVGNPTDVAALCAADEKATATLIGCGCGNTPALAEAVYALLARGGGTLILDADALGALAQNPARAKRALRDAARPVVLTPHPLEFSRLCGKSVAEIEANRIEAALAYAEETKEVVVLKGAATVTAAEGKLRINGTACAALSKAGSGDVLAGLLVSLAATGMKAFDAAALAVYLHGVAGLDLADRFSTFGVTPSDLPVAIAKRYATLEKSIK